MSLHSLLGGLILMTLSTLTQAVPPPEPLLPIPTPEQLAWQEMEFGMFCHFGMNTFHNLEWSDGTKPVESFNPTDFNAHQWVEVAKETGSKYLVVTAKHHDGFCLFPTAFTDYSLKHSPWREGQGDVVREVSNACHELGVVFGFYLSPWDRHEPKYADSKVYDEHFKNQLRELLTGHGKVGEVWFDGAGSEGHVYDWQGFYGLIRELQPHALIAICGPDVRWVGNEDGLAPETLWCVQERDGQKVWYPSECDVPIRGSHWFWHTDDESSLRSLDGLLDIYYRSVGRNANLLLNVSPDRRGQLPESDVARLRELWKVVSETFKTNLAEGKPVTASNTRGNDPAYAPGKAVDGDPSTYWVTEEGVTSATLEIDFGKPTAFNRSLVQEHIALGQRVEEHVLEAWDGQQWKTVITGTTIGHKRLERFPEVTASKVRLVIKKALACPTIRAFGVYKFSS
jgi:alpha-L-fucosidase